jgi:hypothetical protein
VQGGWRVEPDHGPSGREKWTRGGFGRPSPAINATISLDKISKQIEREFVVCLQKLKKIKGDEMPLEMAIYFNQLLKRSAYHQLQIDRHQSRVARDPSYAKIRRIIIEFNNRGTNGRE